MTKTFVDTSFSVALVSEMDFDHTKARELATQYEHAPLLTTDCVLLEIGNSLARNYRDQAVSTITNYLTSLEVEIVSLDPELFLRGFELYQSRMDKTWGLVDCISFIVMSDRGIKDVLTSDRHFRQVGFRALMLDGDDI